MNRQRSTRSSRGSNSTNDSDPREKMKDCCRKLAAFMFTQVGVGAVIVCYAICGAFAFQAIELKYDNVGIRKMDELRNDIATKLWNATEQFNTLNTSGIKSKLKLLANLSKIYPRIGHFCVATWDVSYNFLFPS